MESEIINYIEQSFANDSNIEDKPNVHESYQYNHELSGNEILIYPLNDIPDIRELSGEEKTTSLSIQITCICKDQNIGGNPTNAQQAANYYIKKIKGIMSANIIRQYINGIKDCRRANSSFSIPYEDGSSYYVSIIRYEIKYIS